MTTTFWQEVDTFLTAAAHTTSAREIIDLANDIWRPSAGDAFFPGSGGDIQLCEVLDPANGWDIDFIDGDYHYTARAADGTVLTYIEGDLYLSA